MRTPHVPWSSAGNGKISTMPAQKGLRPDESVLALTKQQDEEQAIAVRELDATASLALQQVGLWP
jgi:hypothetical protein